MRRSTGRNVSFVKEDRIPSTCENREAKPLDDALNVCSLGNGFGRFDEFYRVEGTLKVGGGGRDEPLPRVEQSSGDINRENGSSLSAIFPRPRLRQKAGRVDTSLILSWKQTAWRRCGKKSAHSGVTFARVINAFRIPTNRPFPLGARGDLHRESRSLTNISATFLPVSRKEAARSRRR